MYTQLGVLTKGTVIEVNVSELGMVTAGGKVVFGKYAQITNNPVSSHLDASDLSHPFLQENDGCINAVLCEHYTVISIWLQLTHLHSGLNAHVYYTLKTHLPYIHHAFIAFLISKIVESQTRFLQVSVHDSPHPCSSCHARVQRVWIIARLVLGFLNLTFRH